MYAYIHTYRYIHDMMRTYVYYVLQEEIIIIYVVNSYRSQDLLSST